MEFVTYEHGEWYFVYNAEENEIQFFNKVCDTRYYDLPDKEIMRIEIRSPYIILNFTDLTYWQIKFESSMGKYTSLSTRQNDIR